MKTNKHTEHFMATKIRRRRVAMSVTWDLWWTERQWDRYFSGYFSI